MKNLLNIPNYDYKEDFTFNTLYVLRDIMMVSNDKRKGNEYIGPDDLYFYYKESPYSCHLTLEYLMKIFLYLEDSHVLLVKNFPDEHFKLKAKLKLPSSI